MRHLEEIPSLTTDAQLQDWLSELLGGANRRQLWLIFLDEDERPVGPLMPIEDYPTDPLERVQTADLGRARVADVFATRFAELTDIPGVDRFVLVWERRGSQKLSAFDRHWATMLGRGLRDRGVQVRAQFILHTHGLRQLTPDDLPELIQS